MARGKNKYLKTANEETEFTYEQVQELKKCMVDPVYFIKNYIKIQHPVKGAVPFALYDYQEDMIRSYKDNTLTCVLSSRQTGKCNLYFTIINTIETPKGIKKYLLKLINMKQYNEIFKEL